MLTCNMSLKGGLFCDGCNSCKLLIRLATVANIANEFTRVRYAVKKYAAVTIINFLLHYLRNTYFSKEFTAVIYFVTLYGAVLTLFMLLCSQ